MEVHLLAKALSTNSVRPSPENGDDSDEARRPESFMRKEKSKSRSGVLELVPSSPKAGGILSDRETTGTEVISNIRRFLHWTILDFRASVGKLFQCREKNNCGSIVRIIIEKHVCNPRSLWFDQNFDVAQKEFRCGYH